MTAKRRVPASDIPSSSCHPSVSTVSKSQIEIGSIGKILLPRVDLRELDFSESEKICIVGPEGSDEPDIPHPAALRGMSISDVFSFLS